MPVGKEGITPQRTVVRQQRVGFEETTFIPAAGAPIREVTPEELAKADRGFAEVNPADSLGIYLAEMKRNYPHLLTAEEEIGLARKVEKGRRAESQLSRKKSLSPEDRQDLDWKVEEGRRAKRTLIGCNWRLVVVIAKKYQGLGMPLIDLIQEGNMGLMKGVDRFDYRRGFRLSTHVTRWIKQSITRALASQGRLIRLPVHVDDQVQKELRTATRLAQECGREPTVGEIAGEMGLSVKRIKWLLEVSKRPLSLDQPAGEDGESDLASFIEDRYSPSPTDETEHNLFKEELRESLNSVTPREKRVLEMRSGLYDGRSYTLAEIGEKFGLTRERIRQIEHKALEKLRHPSRARQLKDYLPPRT
ncbi:MAG TPA: sigma-70 family RNA polymerase sigma factor [Patescibacteria group bacterium]|nr:sigma-70 family RNA polymerase sigma factor [Patescibacteria group bacterium]